MSDFCPRCHERWIWMSGTREELILWCRHDHHWTVGRAPDRREEERFARPASIYLADKKEVPDEPT